MGLLKISEAEFTLNVIEALTDHIVSGHDCFIHVAEDGRVTWSRYKEGELLSHQQFHVSCERISGQIWDHGRVEVRREDVDAMIRAVPSLPLEHMKNELVFVAADGMTRVEWLP